MEKTTWKITGIKTLEDGTVFQTYWQCIKERNGVTATFSGATPLERDPDSKFIELNILTEADVLDWIKRIVESNEQYAAHIEERLEKQLNAQTIVDQEFREDQLPWNKVENNDE